MHAAMQSILLRELALAYSASVNGTTPELEPLQLQYGDYAAWQQEQLAGQRALEDREYWAQALAGAPDVLQLPTLGPRPAKPTYACGSLQLQIPPGVMHQLASKAVQLRVTMQAMLLACFQASGSCAWPVVLWACEVTSHS